MKKKLDGNYTRMLRAILNKSWRQQPHKVVVVRPPTTHHENYPSRRTRQAGHCWRSRDELISDVLLWIPSHGRAKAERPARTYIQQLCADTGCSLVTYREWWTIETSGGRWSGRSVLAARHDDDDEAHGPIVYQGSSGQFCFSHAEKEVVPLSCMDKRLSPGTIATIKRSGRGTSGGVTVSKLD